MLLLLLFFFENLDTDYVPSILGKVGGLEHLYDDIRSDTWLIKSRLQSVLFYMEQNIRKK